MPPSLISMYAHTERNEERQTREEELSRKDKINDDRNQEEQRGGRKTIKQMEMSTA